MFIMTGMGGSFVLFFTMTNPAGIYVACILGTMFSTSFFVPFLSWRSATTVGATGTAFTYGLQSGVAQLGSVAGPQLFVSRWAYNGYKYSFAIAASVIFVGFFANLWTWWLTRNTEFDVMRVRRLVRKVKKHGEVFHGDDVRIFEERQFYDGLKRTHAMDLV